MSIAPIPIQFQRITSQPLVSDEFFNSMAEAEEYANSVISIVGQDIKVVTDDVADPIKVFQIQRDKSLRLADAAAATGLGVMASLIVFEPTPLEVYPPNAGHFDPKAYRMRLTHPEIPSNRKQWVDGMRIQIHPIGNVRPGSLMDTVYITLNGNDNEISLGTDDWPNRPGLGESRRIYGLILASLNNPLILHWDAELDCWDLVNVDPIAGPIVPLGWSNVNGRPFVRQMFGGLIVDSQTALANLANNTGRTLTGLPAILTGNTRTHISILNYTRVTWRLRSNNVDLVDPTLLGMQPFRGTNLVGIDVAISSSGHITVFNRTGSAFGANNSWIMLDGFLDYS